MKNILSKIKQWFREHSDFLIVFSIIILAVIGLWYLITKTGFIGAFILFVVDYPWLLTVALMMGLMMKIAIDMNQNIRNWVIELDYRIKKVEEWQVKEDTYFNEMDEMVNNIKAGKSNKKRKLKKKSLIQVDDLGELD